MRLNRRTFVESALALASASLASASGGRLLAAEPAGGGTAGAAERLRVGVVGVNGRGVAHLKSWLAMPDAEVVAICDCDPNAYTLRRGDVLRDRSRQPDYVQDFRRLIDRKDIDVVSIATPNHWHAVMSIWAMQAGKDVYVEKPCSHTVEEGRVITQWARKLGRICQMGAQSRSMPGMRSTVDFVRSGRIGDVKVAHALCYKRRKSIGLVDSPAPLPPGIDFDLWAGPAPLEVPKRSKLHYDWHWNHVTGNGDLGNQNPHEIDKARWGLGKHDLPTRVVSTGGRVGYVDNGDTANSQVTVCRWDDGTLLISEVRGLELKTPTTFGLKPGPLGVATIWWGTTGYAVTPAYTDGIAFDYEGNELGRWSEGDERLHFENFVKGVRSRDYHDLNLDIEEGHISSAIAHLGNISLALGETCPLGTRPTLAADEKHVRTTFEGFESHLGENNVDFAATPLKLGKELAIDARAERTTDEAANRLLTKDYRKGYELPRV
jgi:predicted dehydrogenase